MEKQEKENFQACFQIYGFTITLTTTIADQPSTVIEETWKSLRLPLKQWRGKSNNSNNKWWIYIYVKLSVLSSNLLFRYNTKNNNDSQRNTVIEEMKIVYRLLFPYQLRQKLHKERQIWPSFATTKVHQVISGP